MKVAPKQTFVDIEEYAGDRIAVQMQYWKAGRPNAISRAYLRPEVADRLLQASEHLPQGYRFLIYDAWRPYEVQRSLYDEYYGALAARAENCGLAEEELHRMTRVFVSYPERQKRIGYVHSGGGAVDLTILDPDGHELDMGCGFDDFTELAYTRALDSHGELQAARDNRHLLLSVMQEAGFTNYEAEWWHYDFGDSFWARETGKPILYESVYSMDDMHILTSKKED